MPNLFNPVATLAREIVLCPQNHTDSIISVELAVKCLHSLHFLNVSHGSC
jgi:hypothetical protein